MRQHDFMTAFMRAVDRNKQKPNRQEASQITKAPAGTKSNDFDAVGYRARVLTAFYKYMHKRSIE